MLPTADQIAGALKALMESPSTLVGNGFQMLKANYYSPGRCISAVRLARAAGYPNYSTGNQQYGAFAHKLADLMEYEPDSRVGDETRWTYVLCTANPYKDEESHFQWILRPEVAEALEAVGLVTRTDFPDEIEDLANPPVDLATLTEKARETYIKARIGQGAYRDRLINYWRGCSVTGLDAHELLIASHIKPWRDCDAWEAVDLVNGLLLTPNLDKLFDKGLITFEDNGLIVISPQLACSQVLGVSSTMRIRPEKLQDRHHAYLAHHRSEVFRRKS